MSSSPFLREQTPAEDKNFCNRMALIFNQRS